MAKPIASRFLRRNRWLPAARQSLLQGGAAIQKPRDLVRLFLRSDRRWERVAGRDLPSPGGNEEPPCGTTSHPDYRAMSKIAIIRARLRFVGPTQLQQHRKAKETINTASRRRPSCARGSQAR